MASLLIHDMDDGLVRGLYERAGRHGRSVEDELRAILEEALHRPKRRSFIEVLAAMPDVGRDADFERRD